MATCSKVNIRNRKVCIGDLRDKIVIQTRSITPPSANGSDMTETFATSNTVWAAIETRNGVEIFDGTNVLQGVATHYIYIRYIAGLTEESWILYKSKYYDIIDVQNLEERDEFMLLRCCERGSSSNVASYA